MIRALLTGQLYGDPTIKTAKSGNAFTTARLKADGKDGAAVWCSLVAFGELGDRLATLATRPYPYQAVPSCKRGRISRANRKPGFVW